MALIDDIVAEQARRRAAGPEFAGMGGGGPVGPELDYSTGANTNPEDYTPYTPAGGLPGSDVNAGIQDEPPYPERTTQSPGYGEDLTPGLPVPPEQAVTSTQSPAPIMLRGPQGPAPRATGPRLQLLTPEQASQQEMIRRAQYMYAADPTAQTEQAVAAALKFQAQRMYQQDLASGTAPAEALAKVAPLLFGGPKQGNLGQAASFIKATQRPATKFTDVGGVLYRHNPDGTVTAVTGPKAPKAQTLDPIEKAFLAADVAKLKQLEESDQFSAPTAQGADLRRQAHDLRNKITIQYRRPAAPPAVPPAETPAPPAPLAPAATTTGVTPPPPSTTKRVKVIGPGGKRGTVPAGTKLPEGWKLAE